MLDKDDQMIIAELDRLARNLFCLQSIVRQLETNAASLKLLDQYVNTNIAACKAFFKMLGAFAEFRLTSEVRDSQEAWNVRREAKED